MTKKKSLFFFLLVCSQQNNRRKKDFRVESEECELKKNEEMKFSQHLEASDMVLNL